MTGDELLFALPYVVSLTLAFGIFVYTVQRPNVTASGLLAAYTLLQCVWIIGFLAETFSWSLDEKIFWDNVQFVPFAAIGLSMALLIRAVVGRAVSPLPTPFRVYLVLIAAQLALVFTDPVHHLVRPVATLAHVFPRGELDYPFTPTMYGMIAVTYGIVTTVLVQLLRYSRSVAGRQRLQGYWILAGLLVPFVAGLLTAAGVKLGPHRDFESLAFGVGDLIIAWGIFRYRIFDLLPVAYETVFRSLEDPLVVVDLEGRISAHNPAFAALVGSERTLVGRPYADLAPKAGDVVVHEARTSLVRGARGKLEGVIHHYRDVSQTRLAALGRMADNVAHELNTPLASLLSASRHLQVWADEQPKGLGDAQVARVLQWASGPDQRKGLDVLRDRRAWVERLGDLPDAATWADLVTDLAVPPSHGDEVRALLEQPEGRDALREAHRLHGARASLRIIADSAERSHEILATLRKQDLSEPREPHTEVDLSLCVQQALDAEADKRGKVDVQAELVAGCSVRGQEPRLQQALRHLVRNAYQSMRGKGTLVVRTRRVGSDVVVEVQDSGPGIPAALQGQVFRPYFSTHAPGTGSGFGLEYVKLVCREHGGTPSFESEPGRTVFRLSFRTAG